jgi:hypothetical protein
MKFSFYNTYFSLYILQSTFPSLFHVCHFFIYTIPDIICIVLLKFFSLI